MISLENYVVHALTWHVHVWSEEPLPTYVNSAVLQGFAFLSEYKVLEHTHTHKKACGVIGLSLWQILPLSLEFDYEFDNDALVSCQVLSAAKVMIVIVVITSA